MPGSVSETPRACRRRPYRPRSPDVEDGLASCAVRQRALRRITSRFGRRSRSAAENRHFFAPTWTGAVPPSVSAMEWGTSSVFLDNLVLHTILSTVATDAKTLSAACAVCKGCCLAAQEVASESLLVLLKASSRALPAPREPLLNYF